MNFKQGKNKLKIVFLRETDLRLLNSRGLELPDLLTLPQFDKIADEDCLDWLEYQRGMEKRYAGFSVTTYDQTSDNPNGNFNRQGPVYKAKYESSLNTDKKPKVGKFAYYYLFNNKLFILHSDNTVSNDKFVDIAGDLSLAMYRAVLGALGNYDFYGKEERHLSDTVKERGYIDAGFVLSKVLA